MSDGSSEGKIVGNFLRAESRSALASEDRVESSGGIAGLTKQMKVSFWED